MKSTKLIQHTIPHHNESANVSNLCRSSSRKLVIELVWVGLVELSTEVLFAFVTLLFSTRNMVNEEKISTKNPM